jgi:hypothetical protein
MTQLPTRQQIDRTEPLDFPQRPKADLTITVKATIDGFPTEVCFTGSIDQLLSVTKRLRELGATPTIAPAATHTAPLGNSKAKAERVEPVYQPDGTACCPVHRKALSEGRYGLYCPSKAEGEHAGPKGYCNIRFAE